ncbi:enoyl-CoA delta isomerase 1, mitochondrial-like [Ceratina calcarata]|uniref:Enoyl-CoA delta isomerase 1, mitochondrial n=1 Tax=Ceratina calcarata TaxID=156304 RepID=A0AAJ7SCA7_9HYME|nr:enoyl-CoA delta isomerase 1, mitochondrial-like [Ceratina calcarata]XP_026675469.1 enoyl-CoA delta isomerase 1, mitochondrial-like [Ceratina calcarata]
MFAARIFFTKVQSPLCRACTTMHSKLIQVAHNPDSGIAIVSLGRPPVNSLNMELLNALTATLVDIQKKKECKGVVLTSSLPNVFSAGLDIMEMYNRTEKQLTEFWNALQDMWLTLYNLKMPVAAAINGSSPAGGCFMALSCEYRVLVDGEHTIGLNETRLGISAPDWFNTLYVDVLGYRNAELALLRGTLFQPKEALRVGLVDELASDKASAIKQCESYIETFRIIPPIGRERTKWNLRKRNTLWMKVNRTADVEEFLSFVQMPKVQAGLKLYIESLKKK